MPDPSPALWLKPSGFSVDDLAPVFEWEDASVYGRNATNLTGSNTPFYDIADLDTPCVVYSPTSYHSVPSFQLAGDFAIYCVGVLGPGGFGKHPQAAFASVGVGAATGPLWITDVAIGTGNSPQSVSVAAAVGTVQIHLFSIRRVGNTVVVSLDGVPVLNHTFPTPQVFTVSDPASVKQQTGGPGTFGLVELQVYDQTISAGGDQTVTQALKSAYGIP